MNFQELFMSFFGLCWADRQTSFLGSHGPSKACEHALWKSVGERQATLSLYSNPAAAYLLHEFQDCTSVAAQEGGCSLPSHIQWCLPKN